jgi:hypothetical protein
MTWLAWRQFRFPALFAAAVLAATAVLLTVTGVHLSNLYDSYTASRAACHGARGCGIGPSQFLHHYHHLGQWLGTFQAAVPGLIGLFWGAPLIAREFETGSHRLVWTQSVTRGRWFVGKVGVVGLASVATAGLLSLAVTWWASPIDRVTTDRFSPAVFGERALAPIGYAAFAFALGVTAGLLIRRTLPAMATTLVGYVVVREVMTYQVRQHLFPAHHLVRAIGPDSQLNFSIFRQETGGVIHASVSGSTHIPGAWVYSDRVVDSSGHGLTTDVLQRTCPHLRGTQSGPPNFRACIDSLASHFHEVVSYQPASRYWAFQAAEMAVFVALALALLGFCFWWIRRRTS